MFAAKQFNGFFMKQAKVLTEQDVKRILAVIASQALHSARNRMAFMMSYYGGLRACEIASLKLSDVLDADLNPRSEIRLSPAKTKGCKGRTIMINTRLQKEVVRFAESSMVADLNEPLVKSQKMGKHFSANSLVQLLGRIYRDAGIAGGSSHSGRRSFITNLAGKGVGARILQVLAGHTSLQTTQRYIDVNDAMLHGAVNLLS